MDDLSRHARIQIGSLYHFFPDITAVILSVLERVLADEGAAFEIEPEDANRNFIEYLTALERRMVSVWRTHGRLLEVFSAYQRHPQIWKITLQQRQRTARLTGIKLRMLIPALSESRARELGRTISMIMAVLIDNLAYLPATECRHLRKETYLMLSRYIEGERRSKSA